MICTARKNNVLNGVLHYRGDVIEADAVPNENWEAAEEPAAEEPSEDHTVAQLRELAAGRGIEVPNRATKAEILALLG